MAMVVKVRFKRAAKLYDFDPNGLDLHCGTSVITETVKGVELGECMSGCVQMSDALIVSPLKPILRIATAEDIAQQRSNEEAEKSAFSVCVEKIAEHGLEMKLVDVEYAFDRSKITFFFTANGRVDFRQLVKSLASVFKTRIELRQIGVRDEAKMLGGIGPCGRPICCRAFLGDFNPVSIKMAKEQNLSLNPTKISGICDRLMCCLKYEEDQYEETRKRMPKVGREVITPDGSGSVAALNVLDETVKVRVSVGDSFELRTYPLADLRRPGSETASQSAPEGTASAPSAQAPAETKPETEAPAKPREPRPPRPPRPPKPPRENGDAPREHQGGERKSGRPERDNAPRQSGPRPNNGQGRPPRKPQEAPKPAEEPLIIKKDAGSEDVL